jgi:hypothetical protein
MDRVPLSIHEKSGLRCNILDENLKPTKVRNLDYFRVNGIREYEIRKAVEDIMGFRRRKAKQEEERINNSEDKFDSQFTSGELRPCFISRLKVGQMSHQQRLALLSEAYFNLDSKTREDEELVEQKLMEVCMQFADYNEVKSLSQVRWYLKQPKVPPYKCKTIRKYGWCLKEECPRYRKE